MESPAYCGSPKDETVQNCSSLRAPTRTCAENLEAKEEAVAPAPLPALRERCLVLEDGQRLFQARDLGLAALLALPVGLRLGDAPHLDFPVVLHDGAVLSVGRITVRREIRNGLVQGHELLCLVLYVLHFHRLRHRVLLAGLLVLRLSVGLLALLHGKVLGEVGLHYLKDPEDAAAGTCRLLVDL